MKINQIEFAEFCKEVVDIYNQRIGQYFCNKFGVDNQYLFYETNGQKAFKLIMENYVEYEE